MGINRVGGIFTLTCCALLFGCHAAPSLSTRIPVPESGAVIARQEAKDKTVLQTADKLDATAEHSPIAAPIREHTDTLREAVATAPAAQVADLADAFAKALDKQANTIASLEQKLQKEELKGTRADKRWLRSTAIVLLLSFAVTLIFGRDRAAARTWPLGILGLGLFALAEVIGTPAFQIGTLILVALAAAYCVYWVIDRHKQGRLQHALEKRAALLREIVPVLDEAYENASDDVKRVLDRNLFNRFSDRFDEEAKAEIHELRKEASHA